MSDITWFLLLELFKIQSFRVAQRYRFQTSFVRRQSPELLAQMERSAFRLFNPLLIPSVLELIVAVLCCEPFECLASCHELNRGHPVFSFSVRLPSVRRLLQN